MTLPGFIRNLRISISPSWHKKQEHTSQSKIKVNDSTRNIVSGRDNSIAGDYVAGDKKIHHSVATSPPRYPFVELTRGQTISNQDGYNVTFNLRNVGETSATLQSFTLAGESIEIAKKTLAPGDADYFNRHIDGLKVRDEAIENPIAHLVYKDLSGNLYATNAKITRSTMAIGKFNIDSIEDNELEVIKAGK